MGKKIKKLLDKFNEIADQRIKFHLNLIPANVESSMKEDRETSSFLCEPQVYGRDEEKEHITNLLLKGGDEVSICCIVGMGGLGKTTLAQLVYKDPKITDHFKLKCWVCVSENFVLKTLLKSIIESSGGNAQDLSDLDPLQQRVQRILSGKKFLLVLDDVWNENKTNWYKLKSMLTCGAKGRSIIITTCLESVALITSTLPILHLKTLSDKNCWSLLKHYAFDTENEQLHSMFEQIGKDIVKKCGGVPLAAKALRGLLCFKKTENVWLHVKDSALWDLPQNNEVDILPALKLSYNHLPSLLKQCFSYCSIFPKDYIMKRENLIHLWMANGFLQPKVSMGLEDVGVEIFNELLSRSLFQVAGKDNHGDIVKCKMHDLMHDLACSGIRNESTYFEVGKDMNDFKPPTRHLLVKFGYWSSGKTNILKECFLNSHPQLRTFFHTGASVSNIVQGLSFSNLKFLRVLDLSHSDITTLHVSISDLKHLRYLDLTFCYNMESLSGESICNLRNLQVLKLYDCYRLQVLPENMWKMTNLRYLGIRGCRELRRMPIGMGNLSCLRTLSMFIVAQKHGCGISELGRLDHVAGELEINGLHYVRSSKEAKTANLMRKKNLQTLSLLWPDKNNGTIEQHEEIASIGEGLQPHPNIKKLYLQWYSGLSFPHWLSYSCLPNLIEISLEGFRRCEHLPPLGQLPLLEILRISGMDSLKFIDENFYGDPHLHPQGSFFSRLRKFKIRKMPNLIQWYATSSKEEAYQVCPSLEWLTFERCPKLRTLPTTLSFSLKHITIRECNEMLVSESYRLPVKGH